MRAAKSQRPLNPAALFSELVYIPPPPSTPMLLTLREKSADPAQARQQFASSTVCPWHRAFYIVVTDSVLMFPALLCETLRFFSFERRFTSRQQRKASEEVSSSFVIKTTGRSTETNLGVNCWHKVSARTQEDVHHFFVRDRKYTLWKQDHA